MSSLPSPSRKLPTSLLLLSLVPLASGAVRLAGLATGRGVGAESARFVAMPTPVVLHIVSAILSCLLGAFQFDPAFRRRSPGLHRAAGTQVPIMLPVTLMAGAPTFFFRDVLMASAWGLNLFFAEWTIRRCLPSV
jgi:uncharacterized membrane protein